MGSILLLGLLIGMKHAVEADHVAAVASMASRSQGLRGALRMGIAPGHLVAVFLKQARRMSGHTGVEVARLREPLKLPVLGQHGAALGGLQWGIGNENAHAAKMPRHLVDVNR